MAIWDQQHGESAQAYAAFRVYRDMGAARSLDAAWRVSKGDQKSNAPGRWRDWSTRWSWVERATAYDKHLADIEQQKREQAVAAEAEKWAARRAEHREHAWAVGLGLTTAAAQALNVFDPQKASASEIARMAETGDKLKRLAAEMITDHQQVDVNPIDWDQVDPDVEAAFVDGKIRLADVRQHLRRKRGV